MGVNPNLKLNICRQIATYRHRQDLLLDTIADSAILAAQQVQDKQIELLEMPPAFDLKDAIIEVLLTFIPFGDLAGRALSAFLKTTLNHVLRTRAGFAIFSKSDLGIWLEGATKASIEQIKGNQLLNDFDKGLLIFGVKNIQGELLNTEDVRVFYSDFVQKITDGDILVNKAQQVPTSLAKIYHPELRSQDTPGVSICDQAMSFAREQKAAQNLIYDTQTLEVQFDVLSLDQAKKLLGFYQAANQDINKKIEDLAAIRLRATREFEMLIWIKMFPRVEKFTMDVDGADSFVNIPGAKDPKLLSDYFINRFFQGPENISYLEKWGNLSTSVIELTRDWNNQAPKLERCADRVSAAFRSKII